jgi:TRAP-type C4-dicarboxylate transport system permease small subunit
VLLAASARLRQLLITLADLLGLVFVGWLAYLSWRLVELAGTQVSPALEIPQAWIYAGAALGLSAAACGFAVNSWADVRRLFAGRGAEAIKASERSDL